MSAPPSAHRTRRISRRTWTVLAALGVAVVVAYLGYLGAANWFLESDAGDRIINRKPEKLRIQWSRARTWIPGIVVLDDVTIAGNSRAFEWTATLDHVHVQVSLWRLPLRIFHSDRIVGRDLVFRLLEHDRAVAAGAVAPSPSLAQDARPLLVAAMTPAPAEREPMPERDLQRSRRPWRLELDGISIANVHEISIGQSSLTGRGQIAGGLELTVRGPLRFDELRVAFAEAQLLRAGEMVGENLAFTIEASSAPFEPGDDAVREILGSLSGEASVTGDVESIAALGFLLEKPKWLSFSGSGHLDTAFRLRRGVVAPGGRLDFDAETLAVRIADWTIEGGGVIAMRLPEGGPPAAVVDVGFERFAIRRGARELAHIHGEDLRVAISADALDLARGLEDLDLRVDVPPSRVDFAAYTSYLPQSPFRIETGEGTLESWFEYSEREKSGRGEVKIAVEDASGAAGELGLEGDVKVHTLIGSGDLDAKRFDISGSSLELRNVSVTEPGGGVESSGWWATFATGTAWLDMKEPLAADIVVRGRMRDAKPLLTALASQKKALFWIDELLGVKDIEGRARIDVDGETLAARDVAIVGRKLEIEGDIAFAGKRRDGLLYIEYGPFATALEMTGATREWKLFHARRWFEARRSAGKY